MTAVLKGGDTGKISGCHVNLICFPQNTDEDEDEDEEIIINASIFDDLTWEVECTAKVCVNSVLLLLKIIENTSAFKNFFFYKTDIFTQLEAHVCKNMISNGLIDGLQCASSAAILDELCMREELPLAESHAQHVYACTFPVLIHQIWLPMTTIGTHL